MKISILLTAFMISAASGAAGTAEMLNNLTSLRWEFRIILVYAESPLAAHAVANLEEFAADIDDRDIAWFVIDENGLKSNYRGKLDPDLRSALMGAWFSPVLRTTAVLLIGKDGRVKSQSEDLDLEEIFDDIDSMPMRRAEMRQRNNE